MSAEDARGRLEDARDRHRARSPGGRLAVLAGGWAAGLLGVVLVLPLPELGLPLLVVGLRLLALRYDWAARAYLPVANLWARVKNMPAAAKLALGVAAVGIVAGLVWWHY
ncbi:MAG TPA: hypothetical protein VFN06_00660 [Gaiellaceae bacterium]|nr:hypothetical protein [Gaiellaceae bacterium]